MASVGVLLFKGVWGWPPRRGKRAKVRGGLRSIDEAVPQKWFIDGGYPCTHEGGM